jgi:hypothetical protein
MRHESFAIAASLALACALCACASGGYTPVPADFALGQSAGEDASPLAGATLDHRRRLLERRFLDLAQIAEALDQSDFRGEKAAVVQLRRFADAYVGMHVDPLLAETWQSRHPELVALDAALRLRNADLLTRMKENDRARHAVDEIEELYAGRMDMLVEFPRGVQRSLRDSLRDVREGRRYVPKESKS